MVDEAAASGGSIGLRIVNVYEVERIPDGTRIRHAFEVSGPLSGPLRWLGIARLYRSSLHDEIRHLIELAGSGSRVAAR